MPAPAASTTNDIAAMTGTGGEGERIADPLDAAFAIFSFIPDISFIAGLALASALGRAVIMPCFS